MRRLHFLALGASAALLAGCSATGPGNVRVHEALLYGGTQERITWVYGQLQGGQSSLKVAGNVVDLRAQGTDPLALPGTLSVNGKATFRAPTSPLPQPLNVTRSADGQFTVRTGDLPVRAVYYTDGRSWQKLTGTSGTVRAAATRGLEGAGQLTDAEAAALSTALLNQGALAVADLDPASVPDAPLSVDPAPAEHLRTALYVLPRVVTTAAAPTPTTPVTPAPTPGGTVSFTELARGTNAAVPAFSVQVATTPAAAAALYGQAYGRQSGAPAVPAVTGATLIGVFLGERATGGYSVQVTRASAAAGVLTLTVRLGAPGPDSITTQAITSPWTIVRVPGTFTQVRVVDEQGRPVTGSEGEGGSIR